jgi:hypothetical protein
MTLILSNPHVFLAFLPFSVGMFPSLYAKNIRNNPIGPRACLGRKCVTPVVLIDALISTSLLRSRFFETEGIAALTMLVSRYKIEVMEEPQFAGESFNARKERILACRSGLILM